MCWNKNRRYGRKSSGVTAVERVCSMKIPVLHITDDLRVGGVAHVMQGLSELADDRFFEPIIVGLTGFESFAKSLTGRGVPSYVIGEDFSGLEKLIPKGSDFVAVLHRSGEASDTWDSVLRHLKAHGVKGVLELSVFGYPDKSEMGKLSDRVFCNSKDTLLKHWQMMGEPEIQNYLKKYRTIYNPVTYGADDTKLEKLRCRFREENGIPEDAVVLGDVARPDFRIDYMLPAVLHRLIEEIPNLYVVTRRFPDVLAKSMAEVGGDRYINLSLTEDAEELLSTYAGMDILTHFCSMGESFGMSIAEAMCCGKPAIVNRTPKSRLRNAQVELVEHEVNGLVIENVFDAYESIKRLVSDKALYQRLSEKAKVRFNREPFSKECIINQWEDAIDELLESKGIELGREPSGAKFQPSIASQAEMLSLGSIQNSKTMTSYPMAEWPWMIQANVKCFKWQIKRKFLRWAS